ncbi:MAG TPA: NUDIX domain-containing protein [Candidatus Gastranaerophilales bacterium]|nr:NUDIX domain-containing protein [Candidatus Gastranaerophilales bacterium]
MSEKYKNPALTVDIAVFTIIDKELKILLIKRKNPPFQDKWAIPGGFVDYEEEIITAAKRELEEETGVKNLSVEQVHTFGKVGRDPRGRTVSVVYLAVADSSGIKINAGSDAKQAEWFNARNLPELAFDHDEIVDFTLNALIQKLENTPVIKHLLPEKFLISEIQEVYENILNEKFDSERFEPEIIKTGLLKKLEGDKYSFKENVKFAGKFNKLLLGVT